LVLVGQDGVQQPPIRFPPGNHLIAFLSCLESGLLPNGFLDPPLWKHKQKHDALNQSSKNNPNGNGTDAVDVKENEKSNGDFVFRINLSSDSSGDSSEPFVPTPYMYSWKSEDRPYGQDMIITSKNAVNHSLKLSLKVMCEAMRKAIISRAFYGWFAHCRHLATVRKHLSSLVKAKEPLEDGNQIFRQIDEDLWKDELFIDEKLISIETLSRHVYNKGSSHKMRPVVWEYLLGYYPSGCSKEERDRINNESMQEYTTTLAECNALEKHLLQLRGPRNFSSTSSACSRKESNGKHSATTDEQSILLRQSSYMSDVFINENEPKKINKEKQEAVSNNDETNKNNQKCEIPIRRVHFNSREKKLISDESYMPYSSVSTQGSVTAKSISLKSFSIDDIEEEQQEETNDKTSDKVETPSNGLHENNDETNSDSLEINKENNSENININEEEEKKVENDSQLSQEKSVEEENTDNCTLSNENMLYSKDISDLFELNLHRIDKDVQRCDRNHKYFTEAKNLKKLRNIMSCYVWKNLSVGYMQGMCDLAAPLLILFDRENLVYSLLIKLMERMEQNFPNNSNEKSKDGSISAMDQHLARLRQLLQILDSQLYEHMTSKSDCTHFHFCYRWFLLDFKRELSYEDDIFAVWECIWAANYIASDQFVSFFALALLQEYREIIIENDMDFTDIIKFFNEMAETHDAQKILARARSLVSELQQMIKK